MTAAADSSTRERVLDVVRRALGRVLEIDPDGIGEGDRLVADLGADSLALVEVVEIVEEELRALDARFTVGDDDIEDLVTVGAAADYALGRLSASVARR